MRKGDTVSEEPLENLVHEGQTFPPPPEFAAQANGTAVTILVGEPLHPAPDADPYAVTEQLRARVDSLLSEAIGAHPDQPRDDADRWWLPVSRGGTAPGREEGLRLDEEGMRRADLAAEARILRSRKRSRVRRSAAPGLATQ